MSDHVGVGHFDPQLKQKAKSSIRKKILLVVLVFITSIAFTAVFVYSRYLYPTGEIIPGLYAVKTGGNGFPMVNSYLIQVGEKYIAIDTGVSNDQTEIELQRLGISTDDVVAVFITHEHDDHIGALGLFNNATFYTGSIELDFPHQIMSDREIVEIYGLSIQSIYTPGHTSGCVTYLIDDKYLFAGDLFVNSNFARYSTELQLLNREKVLEIYKSEYVFTGHFGLFKSVGFFRWWFG